MTPKALKNISFALLALASLLITLRIINFKMVTVPEAGLWDFLTPAIRKSLVLAYPILMLSSFLLFRVARQAKTRFDILIPALYLFNGFVILFVLIVYITVLFKHP